MDLGFHPGRVVLPHLEGLRTERRNLSKPRKAQGRTGSLKSTIEGASGHHLEEKERGASQFHTSSVAGSREMSFCVLFRFTHNYSATLSCPQPESLVQQTYLTTRQQNLTPKGFGGEHGLPGFWKGTSTTVVRAVILGHGGVTEFEDERAKILNPLFSGQQYTAWRIGKRSQFAMGLGPRGFFSASDGPRGFHGLPSPIPVLQIKQM